MRRREFAYLVTAGMLAWPINAFAQMPGRRPLIAILVAGSSTNVPRDVLNGFVEGMRELGHVEGRDIEIVYRFADNDPARMPELARELTQLMPAVFVTATIAGLRDKAGNHSNTDCEPGIE